MFLLVPAHPGFPGQIPQSRKTVVCVCVVGYVVTVFISNLQQQQHSFYSLFQDNLGKQYQKGRTILDFNEAKRWWGWQWY